jgi:hypothetical protein
MRPDPSAAKLWDKKSTPLKAPFRIPTSQALASSQARYDCGMNRRLLTVKSPFEATRSMNGWVRQFNIGEKVWCDLDQLKRDISSIQFEVDNDPWSVGRDVLVTSTKPQS